MFSNKLFLLTVLFSLVGAEHLVPWASLKDIHDTLAAPHPTLVTHFSFGKITFTRQPKAMKGYSVFRGYDASGTLRSIVVNSSTSATASFLPDGGSVTLTATPDSFKMDSPPTHSSHKHGHRCAADHDSPTLVDEAVHRLRPQDTDTNAEVKIGPDPKKGGHYFVDVYRITTPYLRNFRIVFSTSRRFLSDKGLTEEMFETQCILATEVLNTWFERDLGIHLVYITYLVSPENLILSLGSAYRVQDFYDEQIQKNTYDIGLYIEHEHKDNFNGVCSPGAYTQGSKAKCFSELDHKTMAHELGHHFGAYHSFESNKFEIRSGYSIMSYSYKDAFAFGSVIQMAHLMNEREEWFRPYDKILNANKRPKIASKGLKKKYTIPPSTPFRFTIDANDPDDGDQLLFFAQQLNYKQGHLTPGKDLPTGFIPGQRILKGKAALLPTKRVTVNRTFYFQDYYDGFLMSRILKANEFDGYEKRYDIFLQVADKNDAKKNAFYEKYDAIVRDATVALIKQNNSEAFDVSNKTMSDKVSAIASVPWVPQRDYFYTKVLVNPDYTPFVLNIEPEKVEYTAGEEVTFSWTYDDRVIPDSDHVTIRLSTDMKVSFPYTVASRVPVNSRSIKVKIPHIACVNTTEKYGYFIAPPSLLFRKIAIPQGFFSIEHDEGIVFATTYIRSMLAERLKEGNKGGFNITLPSGATETRLLELQPVGTYVVNKSNIQEVLASFFVYNKRNGMNVTTPVSYVLANESTGDVIRHFSDLSDSEAVLSTLRQSAGKYMKFAAVVGGSTGTGRGMAARSTDAITGNVFSMQLNGYSDATANFITNFVDLKAFSESAIEEGKSEEEKQEEEDADEQGDGNSEETTQTPKGDGNNEETTQAPKGDGNSEETNQAPKGDGNNEGNITNESLISLIDDSCGHIGVSWFVMCVAVFLLLSF